MSAKNYRNAESSNDKAEPQPTQNASLPTDAQSAVGSSALFGESTPLESRIELAAKPIVLDLFAPTAEQNEVRQTLAKNLLFPDQQELRVIVKGLSETQRKTARCLAESLSFEGVEESLQILQRPAFGPISLTEVS